MPPQPRAPVSSAPPPREADRAPARRSRLGWLVRSLVRLCTLCVVVVLLGVWGWNLAAIDVEHRAVALVAFVATGLTSFAGQAGVGLVLAAPCAWLVRCRACAVVLLLAGGVLFAPLGAAWVGGPGEPLASSEARLTVYSANLLYGRADVDRLTADIARVHADVVVLQEVTHEIAPGLLERLQATHPHAAWMPQDDAFGQATLSRHPFVGAWKPRPDEPLTPVGTGSRHGRWPPTIGVTIEHAGQRVDVWNLHPPPPTGLGHIIRSDRMSRAMARTIERSLERNEPDAVVLAGDFNAPPAGPAMRRLMGAGLEPAEAGFGDRARGTWPAPGSSRGLVFSLVALSGGARIDHVLHSDRLETVSTGVGQPIGADHLAVWATFEWREQPE